MSGFRVGKLIRPRWLVKSTPHAVLRAYALFQAGYAPELVYAKLLPLRRRYVESICAWLGREMGLPIPEPLFVEISPDKVPSDCVMPKNGGDMIHFATIAIPFAQPLRKVDQFMGTGSSPSWSSLVDAVVFDHLIANQDRSEDNLLVDGNRRLWLVDHDRALGGLGERLFSDPYLPSNNYLMAILKEYRRNDRLALRQELLRGCVVASSAAVRVPYSALRIPDAVAEEADRFLRARAERLVHIVLSDMGMPDLFTQARDPGAPDSPPSSLQ